MKAICLSMDLTKEITMDRRDPAAVNGGARMPSFFIPHGAGPCFFMDWNPPGTWHRMAGFLKGVAEPLPARPRAIVLVSAHWLAPHFIITGHARPQLIYDYSGLPQSTYELTYSDPGHPAHAQTLAQRLLAESQDARVER